MATFHLGQDVAKKGERKQAAAHIVAKSYSLYLAVTMRRYGSLITIYPSENDGPSSSSLSLLLTAVRPRRGYESACFPTLQSERRVF